MDLIWLRASIFSIWLDNFCSTASLRSWYQLDAIVTILICNDTHRDLVFYTLLFLQWPRHVLIIKYPNINYSNCVLFINDLWMECEIFIQQLKNGDISCVRCKLVLLLVLVAYFAKYGFMQKMNLEIFRRANIN